MLRGSSAALLDVGASAAKLLMLPFTKAASFSLFSRLSSLSAEVYHILCKVHELCTLCPFPMTDEAKGMFDEMSYVSDLCEGW